VARTLVGAAAQWALGRPALYGLPASMPWLGLGETLYRAQSIPRSAAGAVASLVLATRDAAQHEAETRRERAASLLARMRGNIDPVRVPPDGVAGYLRLPIRVPSGRARAMTEGLRHLGIAASYPTTLAELPAVRSLLVPGACGLLPGASALVDELITLPTHGLLRDDDIDALVAGVRGALRT
jgi:dTDP-4-amino-4,6-dideoxygalactose transaminase